MPAGMKARIIVLALLAACASASAQQWPSLLGTDFFSCFTSREGDVTAIPVDVTHPEFTRALHIRTGSAAANPWNTRVRCFQTLAAQRGDTILVTFWMRTTASPTGTGYVEFVNEKGADPWTKSGDSIVNAKSDWKKIQIPYSMLEDYGNSATSTPANSYNLSFWVNYPNQEIEIGGFSIVDAGTTSMWDLGLPDWPYEGHAPDAPWRTVAAARIEKYRKGDLAVVVRDSQGQPVANADVQVKMKRHAFGFGSAVDGGTLLANTTYQSKVLQMFNKVVLENNLKWPFWDTRNQASCGEGWGRAATAPSLQWLRDHGITDLRGHNLIWPGRSNLPCDVVAMLDASPVDKDALRQRIHDHFVEILTATAGQLTEWDVINEPVANHDIMDVLGNAEMAEWFKLARQWAPGVKLFLNEYALTQGGGNDLAHQDGVYNIMQSILANGGPMEAMGDQAHFDNALTPPERVWEIWDRFAQLVPEIEVTEFDVVTTDTRLQADYTRDYLTAAFAHPAVSSFLIWGFWEGAIWRADGAMVRQDWTTKPNYDVWMDLTQHQWWTNVQGKTGLDGVFRTRGFLGDYDVEVNGQTVPLTTASNSLTAYARVGQQTAGIFDASGVRNAASLAAGPVAPGEIVEISGSGFGPQSPAISTVLDEARLPREGGDTRVYFDGMLAPFVSARDGHVVVQVPFSVSGATTSIALEYLGTRTTSATVPVQDAAPGIFTLNATGTGQALAIDHQTDGAVSLNQDDGVARGGILEFYLTGAGKTTGDNIDGKLPDPATQPLLPLTVTIGGKTSACATNRATLIYPGITQVLACVPPDAPVGDGVSLAVQVGAFSAQGSVTVRVR